MPSIGLNPFLSQHHPHFVARGDSDPFPPTLEGSPDRFRAPLSGPASLVPPKPSLPTATSGSWFAFALTLQISDCRGHRICRHLHTPAPNPYTHRLSPFIRDSQMLVHTQRAYGYTGCRAPPQGFWFNSSGGDQRICIYNKFPGDTTGNHIFKNPELYECFPHGLILKNYLRVGRNGEEAQGMQSFRLSPVDSHSQ